MMARDKERGSGVGGNKSITTMHRHKGEEAKEGWMNPWCLGAMVVKFR